MTKLQNSMRVEIIKDFLSPITSKMVKVGEIFNVPKSGFWFRRLDQKDCVKTTKAMKKVEDKKVEDKKEAVNKKNRR